MMWYMTNGGAEASRIDIFYKSGENITKTTTKRILADLPHLTKTIERH